MGTTALNPPTINLLEVIVDVEIVEFDVAQIIIMKADCIWNFKIQFKLN